jgi:hypothetical protein
MMVSSLVLAVVLTSGDGATSSSPKDWAPLNAYVGAWRASVAVSNSKGPVIREYAPSADNQRLEVVEEVGKKRRPWGAIRFDAARHVLVLTRFRANGVSEADLFLTGVSDDRRTLVFASEASSGAPAVERITLERRGWDEFVERVETAADGTAFVTVSETHFLRQR